MASSAPARSPTSAGILNHEFTRIDTKKYSLGIFTAENANNAEPFQGWAINHQLQTINESLTTDGTDLHDADGRTFTALLLRSPLRSRAGLEEYAVCRYSIDV